MNLERALKWYGQLRRSRASISPALSRDRQSRRVEHRCEGDRNGSCGDEVEYRK